MIMNVSLSIYSSVSLVQLHLLPSQSRIWKLSQSMNSDWLLKIPMERQGQIGSLLLQDRTVSTIPH